MYNKELSYGLSNPEGWILDSWSKLFNDYENFHVLAYFYPENRTIKTTNTLVFTYAADKYAYDNVSLREFVENEVEFHSKKRNKEVKDGGFYITKNNQSAIVKYFFDEKIDEYMAVAYIDAKKYIILICLFSKTPEIFYKSLKPFSEIVKSCNILPLIVVYPH